MSTIATHARTAAAFVDWRGRIGWAMVDVADKLYDAAHRVTRGDIYPADVFTTKHLEQVSDAIGMPASEIVRIAEARGTVDALR